MRWSNFVQNIYRRKIHWVQHVKSYYWWSDKKAVNLFFTASSWLAGEKNNYKKELNISGNSYGIKYEMKQRKIIKEIRWLKHMLPRIETESTWAEESQILPLLSYAGLFSLSYSYLFIYILDTEIKYSRSVCFSSLAQNSLSVCIFFTVSVRADEVLDSCCSASNSYTAKILRSSKSYLIKLDILQTELNPMLWYMQQYHVAVVQQLMYRLEDTCVRVKDWRLSLAVALEVRVVDLTESSHKLSHIWYSHV